MGAEGSSNGNGIGLSHVMMVKSLPAPGVIKGAAILNPKLAWGRAGSQVVREVESVANNMQRS